MFRKAVCGIMLFLLLIGIFSLAVNIKPVKSEWTGTVYIRADGSIDPPDAPIITYDNVTYTLTDNIISNEISDGVVVERDNIIIDGAGYIIQGTTVEYICTGISLIGRINVTVRNTRIQNFFYGVYIRSSSNSSLSRNSITDNGIGVEFDSSSNNIVSGNNITTNSLGGIFLLNSSNNNIISGNVFIGDGLLVYDSFWNVVIDNLVNGKPLIYLEEASNQTISEAGQVILIKCNNIIIKNLNLSYTTVGVQLWGTNNTTITQNNITANNRHGVGLWYSFNNSVSGNNITNNSYGVTLDFSSNNSVSGNMFTNNGLVVWDSYQNVVENNTVNGKPLVYLEGVTDYSVGDAGQVILVNCDSIRVENLNLSHASIGVQLLKTNNSVISGNNITNNSDNGVLLWYSSNNSVSGNNITTNRICGVQLWYSSNNIVSGNDITNNEIGISLDDHSSNNTVSRNNITNNVQGIALGDSFNNSVSGNNITTNGYCGVQLWYSSNNIVSGNDITNNSDYGVLLWYSFNNSVSGNNITTNGYCGVELWYSSNNTVSRNNITRNSCGAVLSFSSNNWFYHNNFIDNGVQGYSWDSVNVWDDGYPSGGNYWSDYTGVDSFSGPYQNETGSDGIGDIPYVIDENNIDRYPLMASFGGLTMLGLNVTSFPSANICLIFENVTSEGLTTVNITSIGPDPPSGFKLAANYYDIKTTANYSGTIKIRIVYDDSNMTEEEENSLRLMQWDETLQQWIDITTSLDTENNVIYGETSHLSIFAVLTPLYAPPTTYTLTITATAGGTTNPVPGTYTYNAGSSVQVTAIPSSGYLFDHWELNGSNVGSTNPYTVIMDSNYNLKAFFTPAPAPLIVSITPLSASILVGQSVTFNSTVSGGQPPYSYQWYLNGNPVSEATSWTFTPTTSGIYYVNLKVTDDKGNTAQSDAARITVSAIPVGGYSIPIQIHIKTELITSYIALLTILTATFTTIKRKTTKNKR